jgi:hypothetical protein
MDWLFEGLGTLFAGLLIGGAGGSAVTWRLMNKSRRQKQRAGDNATQTQIGGDSYGRPPE